MRTTATQDSDPDEAKKRFEVLAQVKALLVSYMGLVMQDSTMFPQDHITCVDRSSLFSSCPTRTSC